MTGEGNLWSILGDISSLWAFVVIRGHRGMSVAIYHVSVTEKKHLPSTTQSCLDWN